MDLLYVIRALELAARSVVDKVALYFKVSINRKYGYVLPLKFDDGLMFRGVKVDFGMWGAICYSISDGQGIVWRRKDHEGGKYAGVHL